MVIEKYCKLISKHRKTIIGACIIWIIFYHSGVSFFFPFDYIKSKGYGAVDIMLFLSGFGIFYSLENNGGINSLTNLLKFYYRRFIKIFPSYIVVLFLCFVVSYKLFVQEATPFYIISCFIGNAFLYSYIINMKFVFNWFIFAIVYFYIFSPLFYYSIKNNKKLMGLLIIIFVILNVLCFNTNKIMLASRIFIYLLGMFCAYLGLYKKDFKLNIYILILLFVAGNIILIPPLIPEYILNSYGIYWYPFILIVPGLLFIFSNILEKLDNTKIGNLVKKFYSTFGNASFELYLVDVAFFKYIITKIASYIGWTNITQLSAVFIVIILGFLLRFFITKINNLLIRQNQT